MDEITANDIKLTRREKSILQEVAIGRTTPQIAQNLGLSPETVKWYRKRLLAKFDVKNTVSLVSLVLKEHILPDCGD